ncbi:MAG: efflux RND transporter permease subunit [Dehalococcoidales bacterium]|nr:efflux RND transporter permease subunit [Dehalococcoidales bacterium]
MWHLTKFALRKISITILVAVIIAGASVWGFLNLKTELIPDISFPYTTIFTIYPQAMPDTVAEEVSAPIEKLVWDEWSGKGLKHVTSTSSVGISIVIAEFEFGTDMTEVVNGLTESMGKLSLPQSVINLPNLTDSITANPQIVPINMNMLPLMSLGFSGDLPQEQLKQIAVTEIIPELSKIDGVLRVDIEGGDQEQIVISPDPARMNQYGVSIAQIAGLLEFNYSSLDDVENTPLGAENIFLSDVASVSKTLPPSSSISRIDGQPSINITVSKTEDANTVEVAEAVNARIAELQENLKDGIIISPIFDQSDYIKANISQLQEKAIIGGILAIVVVFFFLWTVRASLITAISIPLSVFIGFLCMRLTGTTINLLTLSAMTIAVGRLIDDSIVIVEVIYRRMRRGENFKEAAIGGAKEIATPITAATLATVAIFIPLAFVGGIVGELFIPFALTVTFAMLASLLVALTLVPALSKWLVSSKKKAINVLRDNWYQKIYIKALKWTLGHRVTIVVIAVVMLLGSVGLIALTGTSFMSGSMSEPTISISVELPANTEIDTTDAAVAKIEDLLKENPAVRSYSSTIGTSTSMSGIMSTATGGGSNRATITVYLNQDAGLEQEAMRISQACQGITNTGYISVSSDASGGMGFSATDLSISIQGHNQEDITRITAQLMGKFSNIEGIANLESDLTTVIPKLNIVVDTTKLFDSGLPLDQMPQLQQEFILLMNGGTLPGKIVTLDTETYPIYIKAVTNNISDLEQAQNLRIGFPQSVTLDKIADVAMLEIPSHISHTDTMLSATITGTFTGKDVGAINRAVQEQINALPEHPGVEIKSAGISEIMGDTFSDMAIAISIAIIIVLLIVVIMMRSIINPLIIMVSIPLAFIGSMLALLITGHPLGVSALLGMLMLIGIVLTNAIVLISMVEQQRKNGLSIRDALIEGGRIRLRPIIMTALTTILALIPMAIGVSSGSMISAELAIVVIGGMVTSTILTLLVIPAIYSLVHRQKKEVLNK